MRKHLSALLVVVVTAACRRESPHPDVQLIDPSVVMEGTSAAGVVRGRDFRNVVRASVENEPPVVDRTWRVTIGGIELSLADVEWLDTSSLSIVIPPTLPVGLHDVRVESPSGFADVLDDGLRVLPAVVASTALRIVALETVPQVAKGAMDIPVLVSVENASAGEAWLTGVRLGFSAGAADASSNYQVRTDDRNARRIAGGATERLVLWVTVLNQGVATGTIDLRAEVEGWVVPEASFSRADEVTSWLVANGTAPRASITTPLGAGARACVGASVDFSGSAVQGVPPYSFSWMLPAASVATTSGASVTASYAGVGHETFLLRAVDSDGSAGNARTATPLFVGEIAADHPDTYPTGPVLFSAPIGAIDIATLPAPEISSSAADGLGQCDGSALPVESVNAYVTLFVERGELDPAEDDRPAIPGIQRNLGAQGEIPPTTLRPGSPALEGEALVYAEYRREVDGAITAAGVQLFELGGDLQAPSVVATLPAADCTAACWGKGHPWRFRFDEPMAAATFDTRVEWAPGIADCATGAFTDVTPASAFAYDASAWLLEVAPPAQASAEYTMRVLVATTARDASAAGNPLVPFTRCAVVGNIIAVTPAPPASATVPQVFSPDGDGVDDTASFTASVDAATRIVRVEIERNFARIATLVREVPGAGEATVTWDGRDDSGRRVLDGFYRWRLLAESAAGTTSFPVEGAIEVDSAVEFVGPQQRLE